MGVKIEHRCNQCGEIIISNDENVSKPIRSQKFLGEVYIGSAIDHPKLFIKSEVESYQMYQEVCQSCALQAIRKFVDDKNPVQPINIIFDGPPESGRFIEVETDNGESINAGEWIDRGDGMWALRITRLSATSP